MQQAGVVSRGVGLPENRAATVWSIAVNAVMAGCRPEYMPVLLAIVEAIAEPIFRVEDAGSTPGWEPLVIVSGPIATRLDLNHGQGVMRVGRQANSSLGRFLRLYLRKHVTITAREAETYALQVGATAYTLEAHVKAGVLPAAYATSSDPERPVPVFVQPEKIGILVAGDAGRNQSKGYVNNHIQGGRVSKRVSA